MIDGLKPCPACDHTDIRICYERDGKWCGCMNCNLGIIRFNPDAGEKAAAHWNSIPRLLTSTPTV